MALGARTARRVLKAVVDAQFLADNVIFMNSKLSLYLINMRKFGSASEKLHEQLVAVYAASVLQFLPLILGDIIALNKPYGLPVHGAYLNVVFLSSNRLVTKWEFWTQRK